MEARQTAARKLHRREVISEIGGRIYEGDNFGKMTREKAYILGVLCGDGTINNSCVRLDVTDVDFINVFREKVSEAYGYKGSIVKNPSRKWTIEGRSGIAKPIFSFHAYGKKIVEDILLFDRDDSHFKSDNWLVPYEILNSNDETIINMFLKGICDSEGCVKTTRKRTSQVSIEIAFGKNGKALIECMELFKKIGIPSVKSRTRTSLTLIIRGFPNLVVFQKKIGFSINRKKTKLEKGLWEFDDLRKYKITPELFYTIKNQYQLEKKYNLAFGTIYHWKRGDAFPLLVKRDIMLGKAPPDFGFLRSNFRFLDAKFDNLK